MTRICQYRPRTCRVCRDTFQPVDAKSFYCSETCRAVPRRARQKAYYAKHSERLKVGAGQWHAANKDRVKAQILQRKYGLDAEAYGHLLASQGGVCAICKQPETDRHRNGEVKRLAVDHNHMSGAVRGLLCGHCNKAIGFLNEDRSLFLAAVSYLDHYEPRLKLVQS